MAHLDADLAVSSLAVVKHSRQYSTATTHGGTARLSGLD